jgi:hypothetical protein
MPEPNTDSEMIDFVNTSQNFTAFWLFRFRAYTHTAELIEIDFP